MIQGKTKKLTEKVIETIKGNPNQVIYTNSPAILEALKRVYPDANVQLLNLPNLTESKIDNFQIRIDELRKTPDYALRLEVNNFWQEYGETPLCAKTKRGKQMSQSKTIIQIVCSWCGKDMGQKDGKGISGVSHGMCRDCANKFK